MARKVTALDSHGMWSFPVGFSRRSRHSRPPCLSWVPSSLLSADERGIVRPDPRLSVRQHLGVEKRAPSLRSPSARPPRSPVGLSTPVPRRPFSGACGTLRDGWCSVVLQGTWGLGLCGASASLHPSPLGFRDPDSGRSSTPPPDSDMARPGPASGRLRGHSPGLGAGWHVGFLQQLYVDRRETLGAKGRAAMIALWAPGGSFTGSRDFVLG